MVKLAIPENISPILMEAPSGIVYDVALVRLGQKFIPLKQVTFIHFAGIKAHIRGKQLNGEHIELPYRKNLFKINRCNRFEPEDPVAESIAFQDNEVNIGRLYGYYGKSELL